MNTIVVYVKSFDEEWEQTIMPAKCLTCQTEFQLDTDLLDLEDENPPITCENPACDVTAPMTLVETLPQEQKLDEYKD